MQLHWIPELVPFMISAVLLAALLHLAIVFRAQPLARWFAVAVGAALLWTVAYCLELASVHLQAKLIWANLQFIGATALPVLWLEVVTRTLGRQRSLPRRLWITLWGVCGALIAVAYGNPWHLFRGVPHLDFAGRLLVLDADYGLLFYLVWIPFSFGCFTACLAMLGGSIAHGQRVFRRRSLLLFIATALPMVCGGLYILSVPPFRNFDPAMSSLTVSAVLCGYALFRYRLFTPAPLARESVVDHLDDGIIVLDLMGCVADYNPAAARIVDGLSEQSVGMSLNEVLQGYPALLRAVQARGPAGEREAEPAESPEAWLWPETDAAPDADTVAIDRPGADGAVCAPRYFHLQITPVLGRAGREAGSAVVLHDVTRRVELFNQVQRLATTDELTGVLTRREFFELGARELARARRHELPISLIIFDLDNFKLVNDAHGHAAGDDVLRAVTAACREVLRAFDLIGRYGGEEFCVMLPHLEPLEAMEVAERLRAAISGLGVWRDGELIHVTASFGVGGVCSVGNESVPSLLAQADGNLYAAKRAGRNLVRLIAD